MYSSENPSRNQRCLRILVNLFSAKDMAKFVQEVVSNKEGRNV